MSLGCLWNLGCTFSSIVISWLNRLTIVRLIFIIFVPCSVVTFIIFFYLFYLHSPWYRTGWLGTKWLALIDTHLQWNLSPCNLGVQFNKFKWDFPWIVKFVFYCLWICHKVRIMRIWWLLWLDGSLNQINVGLSCFPPGAEICRLA